MSEVNEVLQAGRGAFKKALEETPHMLNPTIADERVFILGFCAGVKHMIGIHSAHIDDIEKTIQRNEKG